MAPPSGRVWIWSYIAISASAVNTRFIGYQQLGQIPENGGCYYLPKMVGLGRALEFAYTGHLDAEHAFEWGLLNYLVPSEKLEETTRELCDRIMRGRLPWCSGSANASCEQLWIVPWKRRW